MYFFLIFLRFRIQKKTIHFRILGFLLLCRLDGKTLFSFLKIS